MYNIFLDYTIKNTLWQSTINICLVYGILYIYILYIYIQYTVNYIYIYPFGPWGHWHLLLPDIAIGIHLKRPFDFFALVRLMEQFKQTWYSSILTKNVTARNKCWADLSTFKFYFLKYDIIASFQTHQSCNDLVMYMQTNATDF